MKKINFFAIALVAILFASCGKTYQVSVQTENNDLNGKSVYLYVIDPQAMNELPQLTDSALVEGNKVSFATEGYDNVELPSQAVLSFFKFDEGGAMPEETRSPVMFFLEKGNVKIELKEANKFVLSGTPANDSYGKFIQLASELETDPSAQEKVMEEAGNTFFSILKNNMNNNIGYSLLPSQMVIGTLNGEQSKELLALITDDVKAKMPQGAEVVRFLESKAKSSMSEMVDAELTRADGTTAQLSDLVKANKYVLVDFWASWCPPCIKEIPNLKAAYEAYKDKGFEIVGISIDQSADDWQEAIAKHEMGWLHFNDASEDGVATAYGVTSIPHTLLIDADGKIIGTNFRGDQLSQKLGELLD